MSDPSQTSRSNASDEGFAASTHALTDEVLAVLRTDGDAIRAELEERAERLWRGIARVIAGAVFALVGLLVVALALVVEFAKLLGTLQVNGFSIGWSALIVGGGFTLVGVILSRLGLHDLGPSASVSAVAADLAQRLGRKR